MTLKDTFRYRSIWMGLAILWVVFYHVSIPVNNTAVFFLKIFGYGGVDIFIFASGIGCYFSYLRDKSPLDFIKRRIRRLAPTYVPFIICWMAYRAVRKKLFAIHILGNLVGIQGFSHNDGEFNWYITGIILCYILTPILASFIDKHRNINNIVLVVSVLLLSMSFWDDSKAIIIVTRLPIFILGMMAAKNSEKKISCKMIISLALMFVLGSSLLLIFYKFFFDFLWSYGLWWYPFILITPFLCLAMSFLFKLMEKSTFGNKINRLFSSIGDCSFEIFLVHIFLFEIATDYGVASTGKWLIVLLLVVPITFVLKLISKTISDKLKAKPAVHVD